jgi:hypothetical protein
MPDSVDELIQRLAALRVEETALLNRLVQARAAENREPQQRTTDRTGVERFRVGDRVRITSEVRTFGRRVTQADRVGTVYRITERRVHVRTDSGITTNRAPHNLVHHEQRQSESQ